MVGAELREVAWLQHENDDLKARVHTLETAHEALEERAVTAEARLEAMYERGMGEDL